MTACVFAASQSPADVLALARDDSAWGWVLMEAGGWVLLRGVVSDNEHHADRRLRLDVEIAEREMGPFKLACLDEVKVPHWSKNYEIQRLVRSQFTDGVLGSVADLRGPVVLPWSLAMPGTRAINGTRYVTLPVIKMAIAVAFLALAVTIPIEMASGIRVTPRPKAPTGSSGWLSIPQVVTEYALSRTAAYRLKSSIPSFKIPGVGLRYRREDVEAFFSTWAIPAGVAALPRVQATQAPRPRAAAETWVKDARRFGLL